MEEVAVSERSAPSTAFADSRIICRVCQKQYSQYTCPRCNSRYCSLHCYKRHSLRCTESFMRDNVTEELQQIQPEDETKRRMMDILKRFHLEEEDSDDEDESTLSEELIQKVLSGEEVRLEDLSPDEIKNFHKALASGEISKLIEPWTPWWTKPAARTVFLSPEGSQLVRQIHQHEETITTLDEIPAGPESPLPPLRNLTRAEPSPLLAVHLVDILYCYCFALRLYNGDWQSDPFGAATVILSMSKVMADDGRPQTVAEVFSACLQKACSPAYRHTGGFAFAIQLIDDVKCLLSLGRTALICALCDLRRLLQAGEKMAKSEKMGKVERTEVSRKIQGAKRRLYFLICWVHEQPVAAWPSLAALVEAEKASLSELRRGVKAVKAKQRVSSDSKVLIQEL